jgi:outer membrane protein
VRGGAETAGTGQPLAHPRTGHSTRTGTLFGRPKSGHNQRNQILAIPNFLSDYKPQLRLETELPAYSRSFQEVLQPDGTVAFQPVRNNNSRLNLYLEQNIRATGATVYAGSFAQRFDDFDRKNTLFNGAPISIGVKQPIFRFNAMRWEQRIEPLRYRESRQEYVEAVADISLNTNRLYFNLLLSGVNLDIAQTNLRNTEKILLVAREKYELGKIARNELLQLQLEQLKAQKAAAAAARDVEVATLDLRRYTGIIGGERLVLVEPQPLELTELSADQLLAEAFANRSDALAFYRRELEAQREVAKAKGENGVNATLVAEMGYAGRGPQANDLASNLQNYQLVQIQFSTPILDWGRSKSRMKTAEANQKLIEYAIEQDRENFQQEIITEITLMDMLREQLALTVQADRIASEKYQIAQERYLLGNLGITDLSVAFAEKDQAKRDYIGGLRDYWTAYYRLSRLTLYDLKNGHKL